MGLFDAVLGRRKPSAPNLDALFALPSAAISLQAGLDFEPTGRGSVAFRAPEGRAIADVEADVRALLDADGGPPVQTAADDFGYTWLVATTSPADVPSVVTDLHAVNTALLAKRCAVTEAVDDLFHLPQRRRQPQREHPAKQREDGQHPPRFARHLHRPALVCGSQVATQGLQRGDFLVSVNGQPLRSISRLNEIEKETDGAPLDLVYSRGGQEHRVTVKPVKRDEGPGGPRWMIGLSLQPRVDIVALPLPQALYESGRQNLQNTQLIVKSLEGIVQRKMSAKALQGPIGIAQMSGEAAREGLVPYFGLMAAVSLNLAIFNLLPIPILDGGVMLMLFVEMLMRRDLDMKVKETVVKVGFVFLMFVVMFVIYNDISKIFPPG